MLPNYILQEMLRRLSPERARVMTRSVGVDPDMALPQVEPDFFDPREFNGDLNFDLTIGALGHSISIPCRLSFMLMARVGAKRRRPGPRSIHC
jgi:hypothetical protein